MHVNAHHREMNLFRKDHVKMLAFDDETRALLSEYHTHNEQVS